MKILFLANRTPYPPFRGDKLKIFNLAKKLSSHHELHLLTFAESGDDFRYQPDLEKLFHRVHLTKLPKWRSALNVLLNFFDKKPFQVSYFQSGKLNKKLIEILNQENFDVVHVQHIRMAHFLAENTAVPRILDLPDAFSLYWKRRKVVNKNPIRSYFETIEQKRLYRYEKILNAFDLSLVCSREDKNYLEKEHGISNLCILPNGVDTETFELRKGGPKNDFEILFTGNMDYAPNVDAVKFFVQDIFPLIKKVCPQAKFTIAGQRPVSEVLALKSPDVEVTGFVQNLHEMYARATLLVSPLRFGAGTQNKVLEAMAMSLPVVCTQVGFEGLGVQQGQGVFCETTPENFAKKVVELLNDKSLRQQTGAKGLAHIQKEFSWTHVAALLDDYFQKAIQVHKEKNKAQ